MADEKGIMELESEQLLDRFSEDPKAVLTGLADEIRGNLREELHREAAENQVANTYARFKDQYPGFDEKWKSGEIKAFIGRHPGHNALSAYLEMTRDQRMGEAAAKKLGARGLSGDDERLKDSRQHGGTNTVLAQRLQDRRTGGSGKSSPSKAPEDLIPTI